MSKNPDILSISINTWSIVKVLLVFVLFAVLFILRDLLLVVLAAVVIASAIEPAIRWFISYKVPRLPAVLLIYLGLMFILFGTFYFLLLPLLNESSEFLTDLPKYVGSIDAWSPLGDGGIIGSQPVFHDLSQSFSSSEILNQINTTLSHLSVGFWGAVSTIFGGILSFILIFVLSFYLAVQDKGIAKFLHLISPRRHRQYVNDLWQRAEIKIGLWMQGQLLLVVIVGVMVFLGITLLGIKHALLLASLAAVFEIIPLFGPILSAIPAILIAFATGGFSAALLVLGLYIIIQQFENHLIYPLVVKKVVGVSPIVVILALIAGAQLAGFLGILLSVPISAVIMEFINDFQKDGVPSSKA